MLFRSEMSFLAVGGNGSGPRWWCKENNDSGRITYLYSGIGSYSLATAYHAPDGEWRNSFIEYVASLCDPQVVAQRLSDAQAEQVGADRSTRRQLQPI